jgi:hypothetical protein
VQLCEPQLGFRIARVRISNRVRVDRLGGQVGEAPTCRALDRRRVRVNFGGALRPSVATTMEIDAESFCDNEQPRGPGRAW